MYTQKNALKNERKTGSFRPNTERIYLVNLLRHKIFTIRNIKRNILQAELKYARRKLGSIQRNTEHDSGRYIGNQKQCFCIVSAIETRDILQHTEFPIPAQPRKLIAKTKEKARILTAGNDTSFLFLFC